MRVYGIDDAKALPGDMVLEQDFIMRLRAMQRHGAPQLIVNVTFDAIPELHADLAAKEELQRAMDSAARQAGGLCYFMANGDCFLAVPLGAGATADMLLARFAALSGSLPAEHLFHAYTMPADYMRIRERTNHYVEAAHAAAMIGTANPSPEMALHNEAVRGKLTPWALDQIIKLIDGIDVRRYIRRQHIYRRTAQDWQVAGDEYFVGIEDMRRDRFPRLDIYMPERLFMELCSALDHKLLHQFAEQPDSLIQGPLHLNITAESVLDAPFAQFSKAMPPTRRAQITFELNRGDLFLNFTTTQAAFALLRQEGFRIALDALHPEHLTYLNLDKFDADLFKIRLGKDTLHQLQDAATLRALTALPADKIIFYRCDSDAALAVGRKFGVALYQGWSIDDAVAGATPT